MYVYYTIYYSIILLIAGAFSLVISVLTKKLQTKFESSLAQAIPRLQNVLVKADKIPALEQMQHSPRFKRAPPYLKFKKSWWIIVPFWVIILLGSIIQSTFLESIGIGGLIYYAIQTTYQYLTLDFRQLTHSAMHQCSNRVIKLKAEYDRQKLVQTPIHIGSHIDLTDVIQTYYRDIVVLMYHGLLNSVADSQPQLNKFQSLDTLTQHLDKMTYNYGMYLSEEVPSLEKVFGVSGFIDLLLRAGSVAKTAACLTNITEYLDISNSADYTWEEFLEKIISELETEYPKFHTYNGYV